ncbi:oxidoreductase [Nocardiopsis terrae]|uniref:NADP-dependent 3-hydroxy acid dehydrogenase YdfG n=1 Tax=Nocardiopsis terrae TaxID=372655 RepID=A0ABR9HGQ8_9ACTN|nr:SDR family oxidoreductase [Nocardiopsis terrae]MBE1458208.1 NADP-dependent 3-hydroxy acid dehydrogenase YdfG [Nocardiopsis terrae]GHC81634.1 oxidoreductase [Nocardiopsis terrae]
MDRTVLITGASSGIGEATALHLAERGCTVVLGARRLDRLKSLVERIEAAGGRARAHSLDVMDAADVRAFVEGALDEHGRVDVLVNNAGVMPLSPLAALRTDEWDRMVDVNVRGLLHGIAAALPVFEAQRGGHVVTVASIGSHEVSPTAAVYCGTKYAAWAITEGLRLESEPWLRVSTVTPGVVESELAETITDDTAREAMAAYRANAIPPSAIARAVAFAVEQPEDVDVNEIVVRPAAQR